MFHVFSTIKQLSQLDAELLLNQLANFVHHHVDFAVGQRAIHVSKRQTISVACTAGLGVRKLVARTNVFDKLAATFTNQFVELVLMKTISNPIYCTNFV